MDVNRSLEYITEGDKCLVEMLKVAKDQSYTSEATCYAKGIGWAVVRVAASQIA